MATARKLPSGSWRVFQFIGMEGDKKKYKSFTAPTKKEAEFLAAEFMVQKKQKEAPENMTVGEAIDRYIESRSAVLSPSTVRGYKECQSLYFTTQFLDEKIGNLEQEDVQLAVNEMAKKVSPKSIRNAHGLLSAAVTAYRPDLILRTKLPIKIRSQIIVPEKADVTSLLKATDDPLLTAVIYLGAMVGLRRSEICALTWSDINFKTNQISINKAVVKNSKKGWSVKAPKSYAGTRTLDVPVDILSEIARLPREEEKVIPINPNAVSCRFDRFVKKLGLKIRLHDLRHYNASVMLALGIPDKYAMERMGHATPNMLKTVYQHTLQDKRAAVSDQLNEYFKTIHHEIHHES